MRFGEFQTDRRTTLSSTAAGQQQTRPRQFLHARGIARLPIKRPPGDLASLPRVVPTLLVNALSPRLDFGRLAPYFRFGALGIQQKLFGQKPLNCDNATYTTKTILELCRMRNPELGKAVGVLGNLPKLGKSCSCWDETARNPMLDIAKEIISDIFVGQNVSVTHPLERLHLPDIPVRAGALQKDGAITSDGPGIIG